MKEHRGCFVICDGGYHEWVATIAGWKPEFAPDELSSNQGCLMESIRKDSECTFGIAKKRFRILRLPFLVSTMEGIDSVMRVCAILHNMLLQYDDLASVGQFDEDYIVVEDLENLLMYPVEVDNLADDVLELDIRENDSRVQRGTWQQLAATDSRCVIRLGTDRMQIGHRPIDDHSEVAELEEGYESRRIALAQHLDVQYYKRQLFWLKPASECRPHRPVHGAEGPWRVVQGHM